MKIIFLSLAVTSILSGCSMFDVKQHNERRRAGVISRATFDLDCPKEKLDVQYLDNNYETHGARTFGVSGCGKKATYIWDATTGQAILNSAKDEKKK